MNSGIRLKLLSVFTGVLSVVLYCAILFQRIRVIDFQYAHILLVSAQGLLLLTIILIVCTILLSKGIIESTKIKKVMVASFGIVMTGCISLFVFGYLTCYNCYTPEDVLENQKTYLQSFIPYHDITDEKEEHIDLEVSHIPGTDYIFLCCYGTYDYEIEYFTSTSPFFNWKFKAERSMLTPLNEMDMDVLVPGKEMVIDGVKLTAFIDGNDYAILIKSFNQALYCSLLDVSTDEVSFENFAREAINQISLLKKATSEKIFLDVPLSEAF